jgi:hypothetical protein
MIYISGSQPLWWIRQPQKSVKSGRPMVLPKPPVVDQKPMPNIDLDYGSALAAIAIETVARAATLLQVL